MGLDMGTSGCKAVVFDEKWNMVCAAHREYPLHFPGEGLLELDPALVWEKMREVIIEANEKTARPVEALAVSAIGDVILPLSADGDPVRYSIIDFDPRGRQEIEDFVKDFGVEEFFEITGMPPLFIGSLAKILWIKKHEPGLYAKVGRWGTYEDFVVQKLGLPPYASWSEAARTMLLDIRKKDWAGEVLTAAEIDKDKLPRAVKSGTVIGRIPDNKLKDLCFKGPVTVTAGCHDMVCAAIGSGLDESHPDTAVDIAGTIEGLVVTMPAANTGREMLENLFSCYPGFEGYVTFSVNLTAGCIARWYRDVIAPDAYRESKEKGFDFFKRMMEELDTGKPGGMYFIPHFSGSGNPYFDPAAKGAIYGLTLDTTRKDIVQALVEGLYYELRLHSDALRSAGMDLKTIRAVGGGAGTDRQLALKANITGLSVVKGAVRESSALGAAAIAAAGLGVIENPADAYKSNRREKKLFEKDEAAYASFSESFERYKRFMRSVHEFESI